MFSLVASHTSPVWANPLMYNHFLELTTLRTSKLILGLVATLVCAATASAQSTVTSIGKAPPPKRAAAKFIASVFPPLDTWKAAVVAGDANALAALYTTNPPAQFRTPAGDSAEVAQEAKFWASLAGQGLQDFQPKILEVTKPQPGVVILVLRIEFSIGQGAGSPIVIGGSQAWIDQNGWKLVQAQRTDPHPAPTRRLPEPTKFNTDLYASPEAATGEITAALAQAKAEHKRVILMFGGNWCIDCHVLDTAMHAKGNAALLNANYILVHVNIGDDGKENADVAAKYQTPVEGVPALAVLDPDGSVVYSQQHNEFSSSTRIGPEDVVAFLNKWKPAKAKP
jgi:thioredoxin 1